MERDFYDALEQRGLMHMLYHVNYEPQLFHNYPKVRDFINDLVMNSDKKVLIYGDYDLDGLNFVLITKQFLNSLGLSNFEVFNYWKRTHELDRLAVRQCIQNKIDYFIIGDTASSDMETLVELMNYGIKVLVIDHHVCDYSYEDYPNNVSIINSQLENQIINQHKYAYSAAALAYVIYDYYARENNIGFSESNCAYAVTSLYSDCMDMSNKLNRALYYRALAIERENLPIYIKHFLSEYQSFNARFIGYWFSPRINSLFRGEFFDVLNKYFFDDSLDAADRARCIEIINEHYKDNREATKLLVDLIDAEEYENFVFADLETANAKHKKFIKYPQNYTGLVANKLSERYGKTAIVVCEHNNIYKGSVRDLHGKSYLQIFKQICYAAGHNSAFGLKINLLDLPHFKRQIAHIDDRYSIVKIPNEPIVIQYEYAEPDSALIEDIALYNEFSGDSVPVVYICKQLIGAMRERQTSYYYRYDWGDYFVQSDYHIDFGTKMLIKPIKSGITKLLYQG